LFGTWSPPDTAPRNGTLILGDFGWPWPLLAVWDEYDEQWVTATLQACPMENGKKNSYLETDTEKGSALKRWTPLPLLPNASSSAATPGERSTDVR
jgi:hypothetical protein